MATKTPKERRVALGLTADQFANYTGLNVNIVARIESGGMIGTNSADKYLAALESYERGEATPAPVTKPALDPELGYVPGLAWQQQPTPKAQMKAAAALRERLEAQQAIRDQQTLDRQEALKQKHLKAAVVRIELGAELVVLRERAGLNQTQIGLIVGLDQRTISKIERGFPTHLGERLEMIKEAYEMAAIMAGGAAPKVGS